MKARYEHVRPKKADRSIVSYQYQRSSFDFHWHYHPEFELTRIIAGRGSRLVGDYAESFEPGDLVLLGANLPHTWQSERSTGSCEAIVIQFDGGIFLDGLASLEELSSVRRLLESASRGVHFTPHVSAVPLIAELVETSGALRLAVLIEILAALTGETGRPLASPGYRLAKHGRYRDRLDTICLYVAESYTGEMSQSEAAGLVHMTEAAFSRYFKRMTGTTFTHYVIDLRVSHACQLLQATSDPIASIAFDSGFGSLANFNRRFRERKGVTPRQYRDRFR